MLLHQSLFGGHFHTLASSTACHVGPNKLPLIHALYEYSDTAVCDTEIAAGVLGPHRYPSAMPGQKTLHLGQDRPSRPWQTHPGPESTQIPPVTPFDNRVVYDSINTFSSVQQIHDDTFSMSLQ